MIRFLKRHVWPWSEIEAQRDYSRRLAGEISKRDVKIQDVLRRSKKVSEDNLRLMCRLAKYERPRDGNGRFTSNG